MMKRQLLKLGGQVQGQLAQNVLLKSFFLGAFLDLLGVPTVFAQTVLALLATLFPYDLPRQRHTASDVHRLPRALQARQPAVPELIGTALVGIRLSIWPIMIVCVV
jgi:hypothetical protein